MEELFRALYGLKGGLLAKTVPSLSSLQRHQSVKLETGPGRKRSCTQTSSTSEQNRTATNVAMLIIWSGAVTYREALRKTYFGEKDIKAELKDCRFYGRVKSSMARLKLLQLLFR